MARPISEIADLARALPGPKQSPGDSRHKVILVVDDDPTTINLVMQIGRGAGYSVFGASSGEECLSMLWQVTPQLIMLDVRMRGLDGFETCRRLRGDHNIPNIPIAFLTARKTVADVTRGIAVGADDFIVKPFDATQLVERAGFLISSGPMLSARRALRASRLRPAGSR